MISDHNEVRAIIVKWASSIVKSL